MKLLSSLLCWLCFTLVQGQDPFSKKLALALGVKDINARVAQLEVLKKERFEIDSTSMASLYHKLAVDYKKLKQYKKAIEHATVAAQLRESIPGIQDQDLDKSLYNLYSLYLATGDVTQEAKVLQRLTNLGHHTIYALDATIKLALIYSKQGSYYKALDHLDQVISGYHLHNNDHYLETAHRSKIAVYAEMRSADTAIINDISFHKTWVEKTINQRPKNAVSFYNNLGIIYRTYGQPDKALSSYQKALQYTLGDPSYPYLSTLFLNLGEMYSQLDQPAKARGFYNKVLVSGDTINISGTYNNLGFYHSGSLEERIQYHRKAIRLIGFKESWMESNSFLPWMREFPFKQELLSYLVDLSQAWIKLYERDGKKGHLEEALRQSYLIDELISVMRLDGATKHSKLFWIQRGVNSYLEAVKVCYLLKRPAEAFYFMEKNKSLYLLEQIGRLRLIAEFKIPHALLKREFDLSYDVLSARRALRQNPEKNELELRYNTALHKQSIFEDSLERAFAGYPLRTLDPKIISLAEFQETLRQNNTSMVEYILAEQEGYGLWTDGWKAEFFKLKEYPQLVSDIVSLKQLIVNPMLSKEEISEYQDVSLNIFEKLFPWPESFEQLVQYKILIIPDGVLHNFPFEVLVTSKSPVLKNNYLINIAETSYLNSASVFNSLHKGKRDKPNSYLGVAPVNFEQEGLIELKGSEKTIKEIATLFPSELKLKSNAVKKDFLSTSKKHSILHLSTHAGIDMKTKRPWMALYDTLVYLEDIFKINPSSELVVLDACKTGEGKWQVGEGIESLSRAFFHAGAQSVIASQWNANEAATNQILLSFFHSLKEGHSKAEALRLAKLKYLREHQLSNTFPYFWASLTLTGNPGNLTPTSNTPLYFALCGLALFLMVFLVIKRQTQSS